MGYFTIFLAQQSTEFMKEIRYSQKIIEKNSSAGAAHCQSSASFQSATPSLSDSIFLLYDADLAAVDV